MKVTSQLTFDEAIENLAVIASLDPESYEPISILFGRKLVVEKIGSSVEWLSAEGEAPLLEVLDVTYRSIYQHIEMLFEQGIASEAELSSLMALVAESAEKMEQYLAIHLGRPMHGVVSNRKELQVLKKFYLTWVSEHAGDNSELDAVRRDRDYEFFFVRKPDGTPYFALDLIRNVKLVYGFEGGDLEEDPLLRVRAILDRDLQASAFQILEESRRWIISYYKLSVESRQNPFAAAIGKALLALFLASNPRNLIQNTSGKSSIQYFDDFQLFLRDGLQTVDYREQMASEPEEGDPAFICVHLIHALCAGFFHRRGGVKQEAIGLVHRMIHHGEKTYQQGTSLWNQLLLEDQNFRTLISHFPNGPIFKTIDLVRAGCDQFDPLSQDNRPMCVYRVKRKGAHIDVVRMPSPTRQATLEYAEIDEEFLGFLRSLDGIHLYINLQDPNSLKEEARCHAIHALQKNVEYSRSLLLIDMPKYGEFYSQSGLYLKMDKVNDFLDAFEEQINTVWHFPIMCQKWKLLPIAKKILTTIHRCFFHGAHNLPRREREDFVEIFNQFFLLYLMDQAEPTSISFTCKDGVDAGSVQNGLFYLFIKMVSGSGIEQAEELDLLRFLLYTPALLIRERAVDTETFYRALSAMERIDGKVAQAMKDLKEIYSPNLFKTLSVISLTHSL